MEIPQSCAPGIHVLECAMNDASNVRRLWNFNGLVSPFWRLYWTPLKWHCRVVLDGVSTWLDPALLTLIPPETPFDARCETPLRQFNIHFTAAFPWSEVRPAVFSVPATENSLDMVKDAISLCASVEQRDLARLGLLCHGLCLLGLAGVDRQAIPSRAIDSRILSVMRRMDGKFSSHLSTAALAKEVGLNANSFIRLFKEETGITPQKYLARRRVDAAADLLANTGRSLEDIAELCGFCDRHHLSKCFAAFRGCGPAFYRRTCKES